MAIRGPSRDRARRCTAGLLFVALGLALSPAARAQRPSSEPPEWRWRQILSVPRIGSRLRAITVDRKNPKRIFVGTEEGTLLKTDDGGVTWAEIDFRPFVLYSRSLGLSKPGLPRLGATTKNNFRTYVDPPWQTFTDRIPIPSVANPFPVKPSFFFAGFLASSPKPPLTFLSNASTSQYRYTVPVRRIALCPGGLYEVLVATYRDLFGSQDGGQTFVRLFSNPGPTSMDNVECNPDNPDEIAVATGIGLFVSKDGWRTFDQDLDAWPGQRATAVAYGPSPDGGGARLYSAAGSELYAGQFGTQEGLQNIYPSGASSATAPWMPIGWIATNKGGDVWLATYDGARFSPDHGKTWKTAARTLLSRQIVRQVLLGEGENGQTRIVLMINVDPMSMRGKLVSVGVNDTHVYSSDDGGETWHPFFHGLTRRYLYQMDTVPSTADHPAGWWIVTSGGVWTTYPAETPASRSAEAAEWAQARLQTTPTMQEVIDAALDNTRLSNERIHELADDHRAINWIPRLDLLFEVSRTEDLFLQNRFDANARPSAVIDRVTRDGVPNRLDNMILYAQASWDIKDVLHPHEDLNSTRRRLHRLRLWVQYATEDAWHERQTLLQELENKSDPFEIEVLKARIETLEAMLDVWVGRTLAELHATGLQRN